MTIGVPREVHPGERRVAATPDSVKELLKLGYQVVVETGAGLEASFSDDDYRAAGAAIVDAASLWASVDVVAKVRPPQVHPSLGVEEAALLKKHATLIGFVWPAQQMPMLERLAQRGATVLAMDCVPRISRAQKLDALSSMANMAGYRAVIEAAHAFGRPFAGQITAAGKIPPARVLVIGAGVAGLAAIGAARSLGAVVRAFDTRPVVRQQIESLGAEFLTVEIEEDGSGSGGYAREMSPAFIEAEMRLFAEQAREVDIIITTALIPGKPAPRLLEAGTVGLMRAGSVVVDLAAEQGGNCVLTVPGESVRRDGVTIIGYTDLPSRMAAQASQLYGTNIRHLLSELTPGKDGQLVVNMDDEMIRGATVLHQGAVTWPPPPLTVAVPQQQAPAEVPVAAEAAPPRRRTGTTLIALALAAAALLGLGAVAPPAFMAHFTVFVLAIFVGYQVVWNVTAALHTPLMSVTNAISGIIVVGALVQLGKPSLLTAVIAGCAVLVATINIAGGFLVTQRMLKMFQRD
ncbi:pyridine nucleotide transhydrogenase (proton pump), alpha subunit [Cupriavidus taiwanensis]|nr:pyridine nucleotide transhydrogenase (proton pump), alpha subunit [Cupriavidus taiwanensis]SOY66270.1 pyridine nucleotide transhydrogenase (proton pump), alpha subunit [Cupriavidus taiwanensis]SOY94304.1 pyridine nucleotide transhydrogenase (proton pump), alpha subunit [Cupriavidus taiwanensis]SOZ27907.1 pyridine nucleotide transhydrogenase (proton pump), alpha subunit [Cupriavidus taiwanensis]SOZ70448.1 pyridine nucleotide transhydrogenase (proton pump), alpha subunit [Cupriavidus taiwanens